jgi:lipid II isoglutaminyl synthase (glutamine-hydrolysing)
VTAAAPSATDRTPGPGFRARLAVFVGRIVAGASKIVHFGTGSVIGGRASLLVDPDLLAKLTAHRDVVLVSATNGKTTTTRLLSAALGADREVVSNWLGANMTPGIVAAIGPSRPTTTAVLEVDERWVEPVLASTGAGTVVLLNLSRDQLDRTQEVRKLAEQWHHALDRMPPATVIANADDPLVAWAAMAAPCVVWVATGQEWTADAAGCPACAGRIEFTADDWHCTECDLRRPEPAYSIDDAAITTPEGRFPVSPALPGRVNRINAAFAVAAAHALGVAPAAAIDSLDDVREVAGRYRVAELDGTPIRLLLAKNPAGWHEALELLDGSDAPLVIAINARIADGHDPSWLWDVEYERLRDRHVVAIGERRHDLAVRLRYAQVDHSVADDLRAAVRAAVARPGHVEGSVVDVAANYTAFQDHLEQVGGVL